MTDQIRGRPRQTAGVNTCASWEQVSAAIDGETSPSARAAAMAHARQCALCAKTLGVLGATPAATTTPPRVLEPTLLSEPERRWIEGRWTRRMLMIAALAIVASAVPPYIRGEGLSSDAHAARHLASWQIGFGVGLLVAARMSRMSHAMLALAATFGVLTVTATAIDVISGHQGPWAESVHLVELIGVFLLWRITPPHLLPWRRDQATRTDTAPPGNNALRVVGRTDDEAHAEPE